MKKPPLKLLAWPFAMLPLMASAAMLTGQVNTSDGKPVAGAMVTAFDAKALRRDTVYTNAAGQFELNVGFQGKMNVRARAPYYKDASQELELANGASRALNFTISRHTVAEELSASLPASAHLAKAPWENDNTRQAFISQCNYCHQVGNSLTRVKKDEDAWRATIHRMEGYFSILTDGEVEDIAKTMTKTFDGKPITANQTQAFHPEITTSKIKEWVVGDGMSFIHDAEVGEDDQMYGSDEGHDVIWHLDRKTGVINKYKLPDIDLPEGGMFSGFQLPIGVFTGKHGPHSLAQAKDGRFWITNALSSSLASFDPVTKKFKVYELGFRHLYPHTVRIDKEGIVWFTITASNEVGRFDPKTEKFKIITLPHGSFWKGLTDYTFPYVLKGISLFPKKNLHLAVTHHKWANVGRKAFNFPYGIDVNPVDGSIWYAKLYAHKIGRIDPKTLEVTEFDTPLKGPRRLRFDAQGNLWIPAFDDSGLMKFDTRSKKFETFKLPLLAHNENEVPYALNIHPKTGDVWITSNMSDRMFRFDPRKKTFITYPMPTRVTWLRDIVFAKDGGICSSSSNLPAYGIEGGLASFICLYPNGEAGDKPVVVAPKATLVSQSKVGKK